MPELPDVTVTVMSKDGPAQTTQVDVDQYFAFSPERRASYLHVMCDLALEAAMHTFPSYTAIELKIRRRDG